MGIGRRVWSVWVGWEVHPLGGSWISLYICEYTLRSLVFLYDLFEAFLVYTAFLASGFEFGFLSRSLDWALGIGHWAG